MTKGFKTYDTGRLAVVLGVLSFILYAFLLGVLLYTGVHCAGYIPRDVRKSIEEFQKSQKLQEEQ